MKPCPVPYLHHLTIFMCIVTKYIHSFDKSNDALSPVTSRCVDAGATFKRHLADSYSIYHDTSEQSAQTAASWFLNFKYHAVPS